MLATKTYEVRNLIRADEAERAEGRVLSYAEVEDRHESTYTALRHNKSAGRACPVAARLPQPPSRTRRAVPCPDHARGDFRAVAGSFWRGIMALDDHWIGDVIGALALFASLWIGLVAAWVLS